MKLLALCLTRCVLKIARSLDVAGNGIDRVDTTRGRATWLSWLRLTAALRTVDQKPLMFLPTIVETIFSKENALPIWLERPFGTVPEFVGFIKEMFLDVGCQST